MMEPVGDSVAEKPGLFPTEIDEMINDSAERNGGSVLDCIHNLGFPNIPELTTLVPKLTTTPSNDFPEPKEYIRIGIPEHRPHRASSCSPQDVRYSFIPF